jgi:cellulose synthase/poly-beta-1,6-N-acetylglucosamine synthase-like glycosyltransferase
MVKNLVRPLGLSRFGLPCPLTGTGMAFPRAAIEQAKLATGNIVEDMQLGLDLALAGCAPRLCPDARVTGRLPHDGNTALTQRRRWEHGHLSTILHQAPRLLWSGVTRHKLGAVAMALALMVPPLSLFVMLLVVAAAATAVLAICTDATAHWAAALTLGAALLAVAGSVLLAWARYGRGVLGVGGLIAVLWYVAWKIPLYVMFLFRPEKKWVRTARGVGRQVNKPAEPAATA